MKTPSCFKTTRPSPENLTWQEDLIHSSGSYLKGSAILVLVLEASGFQSLEGDTDGINRLRRLVGWLGGFP